MKPRFIVHIDKQGSNESKITVNGVDWKDMSTNDKVRFAIKLPIILLSVLFVVILAVVITLSFIAISIPIIIGAVIIVGIPTFLVVFTLKNLFKVITKIDKDE